MIPPIRDFAPVKGPLQVSLERRFAYGLRLQIRLN